MVRETITIKGIKINLVFHLNEAGERVECFADWDGMELGYLDSENVAEELEQILNDMNAFAEELFA